ncbi:MAG: sigma-70 family RNA polymerase sigma factor [Verrucomicrobia bacterium]|nr:sigma-70 family RNA polymerase sigma factor [Verrucomicrobiota bacterium]MBV8280316.1 sigma-70 family RNA polymerase sigma factor [Verrucomicrobiota bacterium]
MKRHHSSSVGRPQQFRTTLWSAVLLSAQSQAPGSKEALAKLCQLYWYPLYGHVRRYGFSADDAQDLTQGFFLDLLGHKALSRVDQQKGKFRSFLLASLQNFLSNEAHKARCLKRGGQVEFVYLDLGSAEDRYGQEEPAETLTPEKIFDARWAFALLSEARNRLRKEYADTGKSAVFEALKGFVDPATPNLPSYEYVADQLQVSVAAVKTLIHRLRKRNSAIVREEIMRTVSDPADVEAESRELCEALIAAEGRIEP